ncbi:MAG: hypothetical protein JRI97_08810 [Deltaproteobacteria bacterium]|nr:hypothetical protein [Deltaproteobacteria bacterium]
MTGNLQSIQYISGMLKGGKKPGDLPVREWKGEEISAQAREAARREGLLELGGVYGDERLGDPVQYEHLKVVSGGGTVEVTIFNRAICMLLGDDEHLGRIHRFLGKLPPR